MHEKKGRTRAQVLRFLVVGGLNTLITYAIFIGLGLIIEPWIAYTIAFAAGLAWTSIGSSHFVFRVEFAWRRIAVFTACYLVVWSIGQLVILLLSPSSVLDLLLTSLIVLVTTTPLIFIIGRIVFARPVVPHLTTEVAP